MNELERLLDALVEAWERSGTSDDDPLIFAAEDLVIWRRQNRRQVATGGKDAAPMKKVECFHCDGGCLGPCTACQGRGHTWEAA